MCRMAWEEVSSKASLTGFKKKEETLIRPRAKILPNCT